MALRLLDQWIGFAWLAITSALFTGSVQHAPSTHIQISIPQNAQAASMEKQLLRPAWE
jgi:hypothetical protein